MAVGSAAATLTYAEDVAPSSPLRSHMPPSRSLRSMVPFSFAMATI